MKKAYVCPKTRPLTLGVVNYMMVTSKPVTDDLDVPSMGGNVKGTAASGRMW